MPDVIARILADIVQALKYISTVLADRVVTYTESMASELGLDRFEEKLYPHGTRYVDVDEFKPTIPFEERERQVGMVGRLEVGKRIEALGKEAAKLSDETTFVFVGDGERRGWIEGH